MEFENWDEIEDSIMMTGEQGRIRMGMRMRMRRETKGNV
jgi:hypothetical protein